MRKPLRRLAGAVLAGGLIAGFAAAPGSAATEENGPETSTTASESPSPSQSTEPTGTTNPSESTEPSETESPGAEPTETTDPSPTGTPGTSEPPESTGPSDPPESTGPSDPPETTDPPVPTPTSDTTAPPVDDEPEYVDDRAYGIDLDPERGLGMVVIACAAGEPRNLRSPDFEILDGPYQDESDGRYWSYLVQLREGVTFAGGEVRGRWDCGDRPGGGSAPMPAAPGSGEADDWQDRNGGDAQVDFAPRGGVETGFGGTARG